MAKHPVTSLAYQSRAEDSEGAYGRGIASVAVEIGKCASRRAKITAAGQGVRKDETDDIVEKFLDRGAHRVRAVCNSMPPSVRRRTQSAMVLSVASSRAAAARFS
jgi:hypothetical protein